MSLTGEINKISGDVRRSIEKMAKNGMVSSDGSVRGTKKYLVMYVLSMKMGI